jgi:uncharacterized membrane protein YeiH
MSGVTVNVWGSAIALAGCAAFVAVYSLFARWWRDPVGRLLVFKALSMSAFMALSMSIYVLHADVPIVLVVRGILAAVFGVLMGYQAWLVGHEQIRGLRDEDRHRTGPRA